MASLTTKLASAGTGTAQPAPGATTTVIPPGMKLVPIDATIAQPGQTVAQPGQVVVNAASAPAQAAATTAPAGTAPAGGGADPGGRKMGGPPAPPHPFGQNPPLDPKYKPTDSRPKGGAQPAP